MPSLAVRTSMWNTPVPERPLGCARERSPGVGLGSCGLQSSPATHGECHAPGISTQGLQVNAGRIFTRWLLQET